MPVANYRLDGVYSQRQEGFFMQRVKLYAGVISALQATRVAAIAERYGRGMIHLTTRGSMEIHWLREEDLPEVKRQLATVGLSSRGACGGAVRGISCSSQGAGEFPLIENLAAALHRHFTGNPRYERLPKKFKIGIEVDAGSRRHLIQDVGLVYSGSEEGRTFFDVWIAGGLGRQPSPGFLLAERVVQERLIPLIEAVLDIYVAHAPAGKRLKHVAAAMGQEELSRRIMALPEASEELPPRTGLSSSLFPTGRAGKMIRLHFFAGQLESRQLLALAALAEDMAAGALMVTPQQGLALRPAGEVSAETLLEALQGAGFSDQLDRQAEFRICPGSHECRVGLAPTRDIARALTEQIAKRDAGKSWAISGCPNSCTQPQLADTGIVTSGLVKDLSGNTSPRFDLYRASGHGFSSLAKSSLSLEELLTEVAVLP